MNLRRPSLALPLLFVSAAVPLKAVIKADNTTNLNLAAAWAGGSAPTSTGIAEWSGTYNTAGSLSATFTASTPVSWQGITVGNITGTAAGLVSIGGTGAAATGSSVTIGTSGIDMSGSNQNLVINSATSVLTGATQTWNVATGRNLRFGSTGTGGANANLDGSASTVITVTGGGLVDANQGGTGSGFSDAAGFAGFNGKWIVNANTTLRGLRHGATAWGTNTAADTIKLNGGTLATGGITGAVGNWSWTSNITVSAASTIDNQNISGSNRWLKLTGVLTGSSGLTFASTGAGTLSADNGFILTGANTLSGNVTINSGAFVRVGGLGGTDITNGVGSTGDLGTATIVNNSTLTLSRNNTWSFPNQVSGTGVLRIGVTTGSATHIVTVSGNNSHSGGTTLQSAVTLNIGHANALGSGPLTIAGNGILDNATGSALTVPNTLVMSGGSPTFTGTNAMTINGLATIGGNRTITVNGSTLTLAGGTTQDAAGRTLTKAGSGTLVLSGTGGHTGGTTVNAGTLVAGSSSAFGSGNVTVGSSGTLDLNSQTVANSITNNGGTILNGVGLALSQTGGSLSGSISGGTLNGSIAGTFSASGSVAGTPTIAGTLKGTATFTGAVTIGATGIHAPGNSPGIEIFSAGITYDNGSILEWEFAGNTLGARGTNYDGVDVSGGSLTITAGAKLKVVNLSAVDYAAADWNSVRNFTIVDASLGTTTGDFTLDPSGETTIPGQGVWSVFTAQVAGGDTVLTWTPVPEPSTYAALAGLLVLGVAFRRRTK